MATQKDGISELLGVILIVLAISVLVPAVFISLENPQIAVLDQDEGSRVILTGEVSSEVVQITNQNEVNITLLNKRAGVINSTNLLQPGDSTNVVLGTETINVRLLDIVGSNSAVVRYEYPLYLGWPNGAEVIIKNIADIIIMISVFLTIGVIYTGFKVMENE